MANGKPIILIGTGMVALGDLLHIIGMATHFWATLDIYTQGLRVTLRKGLFVVCGSLNTISTTCADYQDIPARLNGAQKLAISGVTFGIVGGALALLVLLQTLRSKPLLKAVYIVCAVFCMLSALNIILAAVLFGIEMADWNDVPNKRPVDVDKWEFGYSFFLSVIGGVMIGMGGPSVFIGSIITPSY